MVTGEAVQWQMAVAAVVTMEEAALLLAVTRVVGGVEVEHDLRGRPVVGLQEKIDQEVVRMLCRVGGRVPTARRSGREPSTARGEARPTDDRHRYRAGRFWPTMRIRRPRKAMAKPVATTEKEITRLLHRAAEGDPAALDGIIPLVYANLHDRAASFLRHERVGHTLQPTALLHEAYLRLLGHMEIKWQGRNHFEAVFATCMRRVLVDHARRKNAKKRGGMRTQETIEEAKVPTTDGQGGFLDLCDAIDFLSGVYPRRGQMVELRLFGGLEFSEIARLQGVSLSTVEKDWRFVRAWLLREVMGGGEE